MVHNTAWDALTLFLPALGYLFMVSGSLWGSGRVPHWVHPVALAAGLGLRVMQSGWAEPALTAGIGLALFVALVLLAARTASAVSLFSVVVTIALCPVAGWPGIGIGLVAAAAMAVWRTWRHLGKDRVAWLVLDTMSAMGVSPSGMLKRPEPDLVPERAALTDVHSDSETADGLRMYLPPYLLLGVSVAAALSGFTG